MSLKTILFAGLTAASLSSPALVTSAQASDDSYWCNDHRCYDDQAEETRRLNRLQAQHPGAGIRAVPGYHGQDYDDDDRAYDDGDDDDRDDNYRGYHHGGDGYGQRDDDRGYGDQDDDDDNQPDTDDDDDDGN